MKRVRSQFRVGSESRARRVSVAAIAVLLALSIPAIAKSKKPAAPVAPRRLPVEVAVRTYATHEGAAMHSHAAPRFVYVVSGGKIRVQSPQGELRDIEFTDGQGAFRAPERHALENVGLTTLRLVEIELLQVRPDQVLPEDANDLGAPGEILPGPDMKVAFRNRFGALIWHRVPPGGTWIPAWAGRDTLVYRLNRAETLSHPGDGIERRRTEQAGHTAWYPAGEAPAWTNAGGEPADLLELSLEAESVIFRPTVITGAPSGSRR